MASFDKSASQILTELAESPARGSPTANQRKRRSILLSEENFSSFKSRLATYKVTFWAFKPDYISSLVCARYGWACIEKDLLQCVGCHVYLSGHLPCAAEINFYITCAEKLKVSLVEAHKTACEWRSAPTPDRDVGLKELKERLASLKYVSKDSLMALKSKTLQQLNVNQDEIQSLSILTGLSNPVSLTLTVCGWKVGYCNESITCDYCLRELGLWLFCGNHSTQSHNLDTNGSNSPSHKRQKLEKNRELDPTAQHHPWCPWIASPESLSALHTNLLSANSEETLEKHIPAWRALIRLLVSSENIENMQGVSADKETESSTEYFALAKQLMDEATSGVAVNETRESEPMVLDQDFQLPQHSSNNQSDSSTSNQPQNPEVTENIPQDSQTSPTASQDSVPEHQPVIPPEPSSAPSEPTESAASFPESTPPAIQPEASAQPTESASEPMNVVPEPAPVKDDDAPQDACVPDSANVEALVESQEETSSGGTGGEAAASTVAVVPDQPESVSEPEKIFDDNSASKQQPQLSSSDPTEAEPAFNEPIFVEKPKEFIMLGESPNPNNEAASSSEAQPISFSFSLPPEEIKVAEPESSSFPENQVQEPAAPSVEQVALPDINAPQPELGSADPSSSSQVEYPSLIFGGSRQEDPVAAEQQEIGSSNGAGPSMARTDSRDSLDPNVAISSSSSAQPAPAMPIDLEPLPESSEPTLEDPPFQRNIGLPALSSAQPHDPVPPEDPTTSANTPSSSSQDIPNAPQSSQDGESPSSWRHQLGLFMDPR